MTVGELLALIKVDKSGFDRGADQVDRRMVGLSRDVNGRLHNMRGRFVREGDASGRGLSDGVGRGLSSLRASLLPVAGLLLKGAGLLVFRAAAAGAATNVLHLVGSLAPLLGLLAGLPALLVAGAGVLATFKIGLAGVSDALKGDADALANLAPAARSVVNETRALDDQWKAVRTTVQGNMFAPLQGHVRSLAAAWLPQLKRQLGGIATELGLMAREGISAARDPGFRNGIGSALTWVRNLLAANRGAVGSLVTAFGTIVGAIAPILGVKGGLAGMAAEFAAWAQHAAASGQLADIWRTALGLLSQLGTIVQQVGGILGAVFSAASQAGGGTLGVIGELLREVNAFLSGGPGKDALVLIFQTLHGVVQALMPGLKVLAGALVAALAPLLPALVPLAGVVSQVAIALAPLLPVVGQLAALVAGLLVQALGALVGALAPVISAIAGSLAPMLPMIAAAFGQVLTAVTPVAVLLGGLLADALAQLLPALLSIIPALITGLLPASLELVPVIVMLVNELRPMIPLFVELLAAILPLVPVLASLVVKIVAAFVPALLKVIPVVAQIARSGLPSFIAAIRMVVGVLSILIGWIGKVIGWFGQFLSKVFDVGARVGAALMQLKGTIVGALSGAGDWLVSAGEKIVAGLIRGIKDKIGDVKRTLSGLTSMIPDWKGPRERDRRLLRPAGGLIMGGLMAGMRRQFPAVRKLLTGLTNNVGGISLAGVGRPALAGPGVSSHSVSYTTNIYPQRAEFTTADLAQHHHTLALRARARRAW